MFLLQRSVMIVWMMPPGMYLSNREVTRKESIETVEWPQLAIAVLLMTMMLI
jgi:hypothetical protein